MLEISDNIAQIIKSDQQVVAPKIDIEWVTSRSLNNVNIWATGDVYADTTKKLKPELWWRLNEKGNYSDYVVADNPTAYFRMDTIYDLHSVVPSEFKLDHITLILGTLGKTTAAGPSFYSFGGNGSINYDGTTNSATMIARETGATASQNANLDDFSQRLTVKYGQGFSIEAWIYPTFVTTGTGNHQSLVSRTLSTGDDTSWWGWDFGTNDRKLYMQIFDEAGGVISAVQTGDVFSSNNWYHVVMAWDGYENVDLYVDGDKKATVKIINAQVAAFNKNPMTPIIGAMWNPATSAYMQHYVGRVDELALYEYGLSESIIKSHLYNAHRSLVNDTSGNGILGLASGEPGFGVDGPINAIGLEDSKATTFTQTPVYTTSDLLNPNGDFAIEFWINVPSYGAGTQHILGKGSGSTNASKYYEISLVRDGSSARLRGSVFVGGTEAQVNGDNTIQLNDWTHCIFQAKDNVISINVNGANGDVSHEGSYIFSGAINSGTGQFVVGQSGGDGSAQLDGPSLSEVAFYSSAPFDAIKARTRYASARTRQDFVDEPSIYSSGNRFTSSQVSNGKIEQTFLWSVLDAKDREGNLLRANGASYITESPPNDYFNNKFSELEYGYVSQNISDLYGDIPREEIVMYFDDISAPQVRMSIPANYAQIKQYSLFYQSSFDDTWQTIEYGAIWPSDKPTQIFELNAGAMVQMKGLHLMVHSVVVPYQPVRIQEFSPYWIEDISDDVVDFTVHSVKENNDSSVPIGITASNSFDLTLQNVDQRYSKFNSNSDVWQFIRPDIRITAALRYLSGQTVGPVTPPPGPTVISYGYGEGTYGGIVGTSGTQDLRKNYMGHDVDPFDTAELNFAQQTGCKWIRISGAEWQFYQNSGHPTLDLSALQTAIDNAHNRGLRVIMPFFGTPSWANAAGVDGHYMPTTDGQRTDFANAAVAFAGTLDPDIDIFEIWNEPNIQSFNADNQNYAVFARMLARTVHELRLWFPTLKVMCGSVAARGDMIGSPDEWTMPGFYDAMLTYSAANGLALIGANEPDYWGSHPYHFSGGDDGDTSATSTNWPTSEKGWIGHRQAEATTFVLASHGAANHKTMPTEFGEPSYGVDFADPPFPANGSASIYNETWQAAHATADYAEMSRLQTAGVYELIEIRYRLRDKSAVNVNDWRDFHMSVWRSDFSPKPLANVVLARSLESISETGGTSTGINTDFGGTKSGGSIVTTNDSDVIPQGEFWVDTWEVGSSDMVAKVSCTDASRFSQDDENSRGFLAENLTAGQAISDMTKIAGTPASKIKITEPYRETIAKENILAYWPMDDATGFYKGISSTSGDYSMAYVPSYFGMGARMTVECWVKFNNFSSTQGIFGYIRPAYNPATLATVTRSIYDMSLAVDTSGHLVPGWMGTNCGAQTAKSLVANKWHHVAMVVDSPYVTVFIDGELASSGLGFSVGGSGYPQDGGSFWWGARLNNTSLPLDFLYMDGQLAEPRVWGYNFDQSSVKDIMNEDKLGREDLLIDQWSFSELGLTNSSGHSTVNNRSRGYNSLEFFSKNPHVMPVDVKGIRDFIDQSHGTQYNCVLGGDGPFPDGQSRSIEFNGSSSYVVVPRQDWRIPNTKNFCIEGWINPSSTSAYQTIIARQDIGSTSSNDLEVGLNTAGQIVLRRGGTVEVTGSTVVPTGAWTYFCVNVLDFGGMLANIVLNGVVDTNYSSISGDFNNAGATWVFGRSSGGSYYTGSLSNFAIYGDIMTIDECLAHYSIGLSRKEMTYKVVWSSDETLWDSELKIATADLGMFNYDENGELGYLPTYRLYDPVYQQHNNVQYTLSDDVEIVDGSFAVELLANKVIVKIYAIQGVGTQKREIWSAPDNESLAVTTLAQNFSAADSGEGSYLVFTTVKNTAGEMEPVFSNSGYVKVGTEIIKFEDRDGTRLKKLERGMFGTKTVSHGAGELLTEVREYNFEWSDSPCYDIQRPFITAESFDKVADFSDWSFNSMGGHGLIQLNNNVSPASKYYVLEGKNPVTELDNFFHVAGIPAKVDNAAQQITEVSETLEDQIRRHGVKSMTIDNDFVQTLQHGREIAKFVIQHFQDGVQVITINTMGVPHLQLNDRLKIAQLLALNIENEEWWMTEKEVTYDGGVSQSMTMRKAV